MRKTHLVALCIFTLLGFVGLVAILLTAVPTHQTNQVKANDSVDKAAASSTVALDLAPGSGALCGRWHLSSIAELAGQKGSLNGVAAVGPANVWAVGWASGHPDSRW